MGSDNTSIDRFNQAVDALRREFPTLRVSVDMDGPNVEAFAHILPQAGMDFSVTFNLQNDELHLNAGALWVEWFPCEEQEVFDAFIDALSGLIGGRYRIVEHYLGDEAVKAQLQGPIGSDGWKTIATWSNLGALIPWPRRRAVVQNGAGAPRAGGGSSGGA